MESGKVAFRVVVVYEKLEGYGNLVVYGKYGVTATLLALAWRSVIRKAERL